MAIVEEHACKKMRDNKDKPPNADDEENVPYMRGAITRIVVDDYKNAFACAGTEYVTQITFCPFCGVRL